ncbi:pilus assembly protein TadG-related protein [Tropicimonas sp. TH_r6]|uniref:Tad domain-containing protein n=1 Tax=Tropicimonas sp. TH_r6 TaxID=3082085 RepID=UPI00295328CD|nr:pilus assembly protein TadG-related protein [Tropicimonas sp. TH_r6]MDV7142650.1 pilus assembly protein TadG-related protein [Tropicimonas sp. TH_r6]
MIIFSLYVLVCMMLAIGISLDTARFEYTRAKLQATLDRAVLAAADLDQVLDPEDVVTDYFEKAGLSEQLVSVTVSEGVNYRTVAAEAEAAIDTMMVNMIGLNRFSVPATGEANETLGDMEIALVLDNSGSMGQNNDERMDLLIPAAQEFIDTIIVEDEDGDDTVGSTMVAIVPFATQVNVGEDLFAQFTTTQDHTSSYCVNFETSQYGETELDTRTALQQVAHFDPYYYNSYIKTPVCPTDENREITLWSSNADDLKGKIGDMTAEGATSIEIGTKWGLTMLDPGMQDVLVELADDGLVDSDLVGQPFDYDRENTRKVLVVMSDGENTSSYDIHDEYRSGDSPLYLYDGTYSHEYTSGSKTYYYIKKSRDSYWSYSPYGGDKADQLSWPDVWEDISVTYYTYNFLRNMYGGNYMDYYYDIVDVTGSDTKQSRTSTVCQAAKDAGILVFTIGMDTYGDGDATLKDCATESTYFYDVESVDISNAFQSIALQINQLRLTQ